MCRVKHHQTLILLRFMNWEQRGTDKSCKQCAQTQHKRDKRGGIIKDFLNRGFYFEMSLNYCMLMSEKLLCVSIFKTF